MLVMVLACACAVIAIAADPERILIKGGTIVNMDGLQEADLLLENELITAIAPELKVYALLHLLQSSDSMAAWGTAGTEECTPLRAVRRRTQRRE